MYKFCETITDYAVELSVKQWLNWQGWQLYVRNVIGGYMHWLGDFEIKILRGMHTCECTQ